MSTNTLATEGPADYVVGPLLPFTMPLATACDVTWATLITETGSHLIVATNGADQVDL